MKNAFSPLVGKFLSAILMLAMVLSIVSSLPFYKVIAQEVPDSPPVVDPVDPGNPPTDETPPSDDQTSSAKDETPADQDIAAPLGNDPETVTVTIIKYIDGEKADGTNANSTSFPMHSTWNDPEGIGSSEGDFSLNTGNSYQAETSEMTNGADYSVVENIPTSCDEKNDFSLLGYKVGDSEEDALNSPVVQEASLNDIPNDKFILVMNHNCSFPEEVIVTILKYIDGEWATPVTANNASFSMTSTWDADNLNGGAETSGNFPLDPNGYNSEGTPYMAVTSQMTNGADYSVVENDVPNVCDDGGYSLEGYRIGDNEADAFAASNTETAELTNIHNNKFILVMNHDCSAPANTSISGMKFNDLNGDGVQDSGEPGLEGWTIIIDQDGYGTKTLTDADGNYSFPNLPAGHYTICEQFQPGWSQTYPETDQIDCNEGNGYQIVDDGIFTDVNFGNHLEPCVENDSQTLVSDSDTQVDTHDAVAVTPPHPAWTSISGATWIWSEALNGNGSSPAPSTKTFIKQFTITGTPLNSLLDIAADNYYSVTINGNPFNTGTSASDLDNFSSADTWNIPASDLLSGSNSIEFTVTNPLDNPEGGTFGDPNPAGLLYKITANNNGCENPPPSFVKVHIFKYLDDGDTETQVPDDSTLDPFPMHSSWQAANLNGGVLTEGDYVLGNNHGGATLRYSADTSPMQVQVDYYSTYEKTTDIDPGSQVVPINSEVCPAGKFRLLGYKSGDSLAEAEGALLTNTPPEYEDFSIDKYLIVVNEDCDEEGGDEEGPTLTLIKHTIGGNGTFNFIITGETSTSTQITTVDGYGSVEIDLNEGTSTVHEFVSDGWDFTDSECVYGNESVGLTPIAGSEEINVDDDDHVTCTFTNTIEGFEGNNGSISGMKFNDQNGNSEQDGGDNGLSDWPITITGPDQFSDQTITDQDGNYSFNDLADGTYTICEGQEQGWQQTFPTASTPNETACSIFNGYQITVTNGDVHSDNDFGNTENQPQDSGDDSNGSHHGSNSGGGGGGSEGSVLGAATGPEDQSCPLYLTDYLRINRPNNPEQVTKLQTFLNEFQNSGLPLTGFFGVLTDAAVKVFQLSQESFIRDPWTNANSPITDAEWPTGYVYKTTKWRINSIKCPDANYPLPLLP